MTNSAIQVPFKFFHNIDGTPLTNGNIYIGTVNLNPKTNPVSVYWDASLTTPAVQPIRTLNGFPSRNGTPGNIYVASGGYSITVEDANDNLMYSKLDEELPATGVTVATMSALVAIDTSNLATGSVYYVEGYHSADDGGGGFFIWDSTGDKANHNAGSIIDPDVTFPTTWSNDSQRTAWYTAGTGTGIWRREYEDKYNPVHFGATRAGLVDDLLAFQEIFSLIETAGFGSVYLPKGTYLLSEQIGSTGSTNLTEIEFIGEVGTIIDCNPTSYANYILDFEWQNLSKALVENIHVKGNTKCSIGIMVRSTSTTVSESFIVRNCIAEDLHAVNDAGVTATPTGIYVDSGAEGKIGAIYNCRIEDVTRDKNLASSGIVLTHFENMVVDGCHIKNIQFNTSNKNDADGIKIFSYNTASVYNKTNVNVANNTIIDCQGRFIKLQTNGAAAVKNNTCRIDSAIELITNFVGIDTQIGSADIVNNNLYFGTGWTGGTASCAAAMTTPTAIDHNYEGFVQTFESNIVTMETAIDTVINIGDLPQNVIMNVYYNILNNVVNCAEDLYDTNQSNERPDAFVYANGNTWTAPANWDGMLVINVSGNIVYTYEFLQIIASTPADYTDKMHVICHDNVKYSFGYARALLATGNHYTSNLSVSGNTCGSDLSATVAWEFDFQKLLSGCNFLTSTQTLTNGPASYTNSNVQKDGGFYKVVRASNIYLSSDASTWNNIT